MLSNADVELVVSAKWRAAKFEVWEAVFVCQCRRLLGDAGRGLNTQSERRSLPAE